MSAVIWSVTKAKKHLVGKIMLGNYFSPCQAQYRKATQIKVSKNNVQACGLFSGST